MIQRACIVDCDVHQGNGTNAIFADDASVYTFDMHGAKNFPFRKVPASRDEPLEDGVGDYDYLSDSPRHCLPCCATRAQISWSTWLAPIHTRVIDWAA